jgi:hypothetical protein
MLRLCHNLNRYSTDLDFWITPDTDSEKLFQKIYEAFFEKLKVSDASSKRFTLLFEVQSQNSPRKLKIEIRKEQSRFDWERKIAFSKFANIQVMVKGLTLTQMMSNKIEAFLARGVIRDCYDIEFLLYRGVPMNFRRGEMERRLDAILGFQESDYKIALGSVLEPQDREFVVKNRFRFLKEEIRNQLNLA